MDAQYPTYGRPHHKAKIHMSSDGYPRWHWWDSSIKNNRMKFLHVWVWEQHYGPIPEGHDIHHMNEDRTDYRIENLEMVTHGDHRRVHAEMKFDGGKKQCRDCGEWKPLDQFPKRSKKARGLYLSYCRECKSKMDKEYREGPKREERLRKKRAYCEANREKERARAKAWYEKNRQKVLDRQKAQRDADAGGFSQTL